MKRVRFSMGCSKPLPPEVEAHRKKPRCEAQTMICSGELIATYGVNGSEKEGKVFAICGPCAAYLNRTNKLKLVKPTKETK